MLIPTPSYECPLCTPPKPINKAHLEPFRRLWCKAGADLGEKWGSCGRMWGLLWVKVELDLGKCQDVARGESFICFVIIPCANLQIFDCVECWFQCEGGLGS